MLAHRGYPLLHSPPPHTACFRFLKVSLSPFRLRVVERHFESNLFWLAKNRFKPTQARLRLLIGSGPRCGPTINNRPPGFSPKQVQVWLLSQLNRQMFSSLRKVIWNPSLIIINADQSLNCIFFHQVATAVNGATENSLVIVDEVAKGTAMLLLLKKRYKQRHTKYCFTNGSWHCPQRCMFFLCSLVQIDGLTLLTATLRHWVRKGTNCPKMLVSTHFHSLVKQKLLPQTPLATYQVYWSPQEL